MIKGYLAVLILGQSFDKSLVDIVGRLLLKDWLKGVLP